MTRLFNSFLRLEKWFFGVSAAVLVLLMLLVSANVLSRHFFDRPILGTLEITEFFMVAIVYLALSNRYSDLCTQGCGPSYSTEYGLYGYYALFPGRLSYCHWFAHCVSRNCHVSSESDGAVTI